MKKVFLSVTFLIFTIATASAHTGIMWGENDIKYISTEHFDIIYEPDSADSAALLYENAERILEEVQNFFGADEITTRVPVVISANCQMFNALCGYIPYTYINLYDTAVDESMTVFSNDLLSTFKHELTHAYTLNMKNKRVATATKILGNLYNPALIFSTSGMAESATLTSESSLGEGRLNDEWSLQVTRQAKIEDKWPGYYDEQGHSTKYYTGDFYYFNGGFADYLQKTYGMEKYAQFWYNCVNPKSISTATTFKKIYGVKIWDAWQDFKDALEVPEYSEPFETDGINDFFTNTNENYSVENNRGAIYQNLSATEKGIFYTDYKSKSVYFVSNEQLEKNLSGKKISPKKIFHKTGLTNISPSSDGRFISYCYYDFSSPNYKCCVGVYDTKTKRHYKVGDSLKTPAIIKNGEDYYLLALNFISQKKQIAVQKFDFKNQKLKGFEQPEYIPLAEGTNILSFADVGNGKYAMIVKGGMKWELCFGTVYGAGENNFEKIDLPEERMTMRYLSYSASDNTLYFSWTKPNSMPRIGKFLLDENQFTLSDKNISGGVYYPVALSNSQISEDKIFYIGEFTKQNRIFSYDNNSENTLLIGTTPTVNFATKDFSEVPEDVITLQNPAEETLADAKKYHSIKYYLHPAIIPLSTCTSSAFDVREKNFGDSTLFSFLGITLLGAAPWNGILQLSAGYGIETKSFALSAAYQGGTGTDLFNYSVSGQVELDKNFFKQALASTALSLNFNYVSLYDNATLLVGRNNIYTFGATPDFIENARKDNLFYVENQAGLSIGKSWAYESELFNTVGAYWNVYINNVFEKTLTGEQFNYNSVNLGTSVDVYIPKLLPIKCYDRFVYNLPSELNVAAFTNVTDVVSGSVKTTVFGFDIQRGIPFFFFNKIYIDVGYSFAFNYENYRNAGNFEIFNIQKHFASLAKGVLPYTDKIFIDINFTLCPNIGMVGGDLTPTFEFFYKPNPLPSDSINWGFTIGINGLF